MHSPYPIRLDTPPPQSHFRRPWSPQELEPLGTSRARIERQETSESYEALDLADYATTLHRTNVQSSFREPGPYPPFSSPGRQYLEYPATPPRSFTFASRGSYPSPPSLVSAGSSSAQTHSRSTRSHVPQHRPFSLPAPTPHYPYTPPGSNSGHSHNYPRIFEAQSPALPHEPRVDLSAFPEWSREWYDRPKTQMPGGFEPYDSFNTYDVDYPSQSHDGLLGFPAKQHSVTNDSHRSLLPWSGEDDASHTHVTSEMKEERLRMLEKEFGHNGIDSSVIDQAKVIGSVDAKGNIITDGPKKRIITRYVQFTFVLGTTIASLYSALVCTLPLILYSSLNRSSYLDPKARRNPSTERDDSSLPPLCALRYLTSCNSLHLRVCAVLLLGTAETENGARRARRYDGITHPRATRDRAKEGEEERQRKEGQT